MDLGILADATASEYFSSHRIHGILVKYKQELFRDEVSDISGQTLKVSKLFMRFSSGLKFRTLRESKFRRKGLIRRKKNPDNPI